MVQIFGAICSALLVFDLGLFCGLARHRTRSQIQSCLCFAISTSNLLGFDLGRFDAYEFQGHRSAVLPAHPLPWRLPRTPRHRPRACSPLPPPCCSLCQSSTGSPLPSSRARPSARSARARAKARASTSASSWSSKTSSRQRCTPQAPPPARGSCTART